MSAAVSERGVGGSGLPSTPPARVSVDTIIRVVADDFGVSRREILSGRRDAELVRARHVAMWLARRLTFLSYPCIGDRFDGRDHTTIMHGCARVDELMLTDCAVAERVIALMSAVTEGMAAVTSLPAPPRLIPQQPSMDTIVQMVAATFGVNERDIVSKDRNDATTVLARHTGMWLARRLTKASLPTIGDRFQRLPRSVMKAIVRIDTILKTDDGAGQMVLGLMDCLTLPPVAA